MNDDWQPRSCAIAVFCYPSTALDLWDFTTSPDPASFRSVGGLFELYNRDGDYFQAFFPSADGDTLFGPDDATISDLDSPMTTSPTDAGWRFKDGVFQIQCPDTGGWRAPFVSGDQGSEELVWGPEDVSASDPDTDLSATGDYTARINGGFWQLKNDTTGFFHTIWPSGTAGNYQMNVGPGEI